MAIKFDLEKMYDFISWDFIRAVLIRFGFNTHWIDLIMECITSTSFSMLVNGKAHGFFLSFKGYLAGWSLSPYIFIL